MKNRKLGWRENQLGQVNNFRAKLIYFLLFFALVVVTADILNSLMEVINYNFIYYNEGVMKSTCSRYFTMKVF